MGLALSIGGQECRIEGPLPILEAAARHYRGFASPGNRGPGWGSPIVIEVGPHDRESGEGRVIAETFPARLRGPQELNLAAGAGEVLRLPAGPVFPRELTELGSVDLLLRFALSIVLPLRGGLLLHAAALRRPDREGLALCGAPGTGKSTAAAALEGACDELAVLRMESGEVELLSTPYWRGLPYQGRCADVIGLVRGRPAGLCELRSSEAVRLLLRHVVRYVVWEEVERTILKLAGDLCPRLRVREAACPEGAAFLPFLAGAIGWKEAS